MSKRNRSKKLKTENPGQFVLLPVAIILSIIPLIVFSKLIQLSGIEIENWLGEPIHADFFSFYKSQWLMVCTVLAILFFFSYYLIKGLKLEKSFLYIPTAVYAVLIILSAVTSKYPDVVYKGFAGRHEGMYVLLCYLLLMLIVFNLVKAENQIKFLLSALLISAAIICLIGMFQFLGIDLFRSDFGKQLILPRQYHQYKDSLDFRFEDTYIYSTLQNPNYVGSYTVLLIPVAFAFIAFSKKPYLKAGGAVLVGLLMLNLFGSRSRAGLVGIFVIVVIAVVLFRKAIFKKKLLALAIVAGMLVLFFGADYALKGTLTKRVISEFSILSSDEVQFYDLQDITFKDNTVSIISSTETLTIGISEDSLYFTDTQGKNLEPIMKEAEDKLNISFTDSVYKNYNITIKGGIFTIDQQGINFRLICENNEFKLLGTKEEQVDDIIKPASLGFSGKERLGSARGYIWSRSLPLLKNSLLLGYGPDTFVIEFPQYDYIGKIRAYGTTQMIVDKPHNMFLQIAMNTGVLSLLSVLVLFGFYIVQSLKLYIKNINNKSIATVSGVGIFLGICGYLGAAFFNDSIVAIAPVFWVLLGLGFVCNGFYKKQYDKERQKNG